MEDIIQIEGTKDTPSILLDLNKRIFKVSGPSFPENANKAYAPVLDWLDAFMPSLNGEMNCEFYYYYLNSSSKRIVYKILKKLDEAYLEGKKVIISWIHDEFDDDMYELGEEFADLLKIPFNFVTKD